MRPIKLFTDSTSDLTKELYESIDCKVLPLGVSFGERHFVDGVDIDTKKIYELVKETGTLPKTNAVNINVFEENFKNASMKETILYLYLFQATFLVTLALQIWLLFN